MFVIVILSAILGLIGTDIFAPSLPQIAQVFHQPPHTAQLTISLFLGGFAFSQLFYGPISDNVGRKPPLIFGNVVFIVGSIICLTAHTFIWLCIGRIIQGIGVGGGLSLARVILRDCYRDTALAVRSSQVAIFISLTPAIAPFFGGILQQQFGFRASFFFMLLYGLILLALMATYFQETNKNKTHDLTLRSALAHYKQLLQNGFFIRFALISGFAFAVIILCANMMPFIIQTQLRLSAVMNGWMLLIAAFGVSFGSVISSRQVVRFGSEKLIRLGLIILLFSGLTLILSEYIFGLRLFWLVSLIFLATVSCGLIFPNALALCFSKVSTNIGVGGAIYGSIQIFISTLINLVLNTIVHQSQSLLGIFYTAMSIGGLLLFYCGSVKKLTKVATISSTLK